MQSTGQLHTGENLGLPMDQASGLFPWAPHWGGPSERLPEFLRWQSPARVLVLAPVRVGASTGVQRDQVGNRGRPGAHHPASSAATTITTTTFAAATGRLIALLFDQLIQLAVLEHLAQRSQGEAEHGHGGAKIESLLQCPGGTHFVSLRRMRKPRLRGCHRSVHLGRRPDQTGRENRRPESPAVGVHRRNHSWPVAWNQAQVCRIGGVLSETQCS